MKNYLIRVNGIEYEVEVEEISNNPGISTTVAQSNAVLKPAAKPSSKQKSKLASKQEANVLEGTESVDAPMPGTIFNINVSEGEEVKAGQVLLILEAMKMENEIVSPRDGKVVAVHEEKGAAVNTGDKLVSIE